MPFPRMTTRRWMPAVAVSGVICGGGGALIGHVAPSATIVFYEFEGPWVALGYSPVAWGATRGRFWASPLGLSGTSLRADSTSAVEQ